MRVLQIEDDAMEARSTELLLKSEGFNVYTTDLGEEGIDLAKLYDYDIVLLDLSLPDIPGHEVLSRLRNGKVTTPVLILTEYAGSENTVRCLNSGADDVVSKPFHKDELIARIYALVRRARGNAQSTVKFGEIEVDLREKTVRVNDKDVKLTIKEFEMLELLVLRKGQHLTKEMFLNHMYGGVDEPEMKIVDVFICKLRRKLAVAAEGRQYIQTVWGRGYVLGTEPIQVHSKVRPKSLNRLDKTRSGCRFAILKMLYTHALPQTTRELQTALRFNKENTTAYVCRLTRSGHIEAVGGKTYGRSYKITDKGRALYEELLHETVVPQYPDPENSEGQNMGPDSEHAEAAHPCDRGKGIAA